MAVKVEEEAKVRGRCRECLTWPSGQGGEELGKVAVAVEEEAKVGKGWGVRGAEG